MNIFVLAPYSRNSSLFELRKNIHIYRYKYQPGFCDDLAYEGGILSKKQRNKFNALRVPMLLFCQFIALGRVVRKEKINIVHAHWLIPQGLIECVYKALFCRKLKINFTAHGADAEKVSICTEAVEDLKFIKKVSEMFWRQSILICIIVKKDCQGRYRLYIFNGRKLTTWDAVDFAAEIKEQGAGELLINSIERDGTYKGYDTEIIQGSQTA